MVGVTELAVRSHLTSCACKGARATVGLLLCLPHGDVAVALAAVITAVACTLSKVVTIECFTLPKHRWKPFVSRTKATLSRTLGEGIVLLSSKVAVGS